MTGEGSIELLERFRALARDFREAATRGDLPSMDAILSERRALLGRLGPVDPGSSPEENRPRRELLEAILDLDREAERILEGQRDDLGAQLVALDEGRRGLEGYRAGAGGRSRIDERG